MDRDGSLIHPWSAHRVFFLQREGPFVGYVVLSAICVVIQSIAYSWADSTREGGTELVLRPCVVGDPPPPWWPDDCFGLRDAFGDCETCTQIGLRVVGSWNDLVLEGETVWSANKQAGLMLLILSSLSCAMGFCVLCCGSTDPDSVAVTQRCFSRYVRCPVSLTWEVSLRYCRPARGG